MKIFHNKGIKYTDKQLLDCLQELLDRRTYTGKCVLRMSTTGRGFRLHETEQEGAVDNIRKAISNFLELNKKVF